MITYAWDAVKARNWKKSFELFQELQGRRLVPNTRSLAERLLDVESTAMAGSCCADERSQSI